MDRERWIEVDRIFAAALQREPPEREAFLVEACAGDDRLRKEVESLIAHDQPASFLEQPAIEEATRLLTREQAEMLTGKTIGSYTIIRPLGAGAMGRVYLAQGKRLNRPIAVKLLSNYHAAEEERISRFRQEALAASALNHPNIRTIYEIGDFEGQNFIATEFVDGLTLRARLVAGDLPLNASLEIAIQVASALSAAHAAGIVHRDIKPENVMVRADGLVKLLDFGIAKYMQSEGREKRDLVETMPGAVIGTTAYMSPEQARGLHVDARTDIWSLGVVLYETLAGHKPFSGATGQDVITSVLEREPAPLSRSAPDSPEALDWIISMALRKDRKLRYQTVTEFLVDLRDLKRRLEFAMEQDRSGGANGETPLSVAKESLLQSFGGASIHSRGTKPPSVSPLRTMAVLPFKPLMIENRDASLEMGMADTLIAKLSSSRGVIVRPLGSERKYGELDQDPVAAGRELGVASLLDGNIQRSGDHVRVTVRLVEIPSGESLWAGTFDEKFTNIFAIQDAISEKVAESLALQLSTGEQKRLTKRYTENTEAYELYLKGRYFWEKRTQSSSGKAIEYFQQAIEKDSAYALAYSGLADCYLTLLITSDLAPKDACPKAKAATQRALELDDALAEAHTSLAGIKFWFDWDWAGAEVEFKRANELNPNYAAAHRFYGHFLSNMGRHAEAIRETRHALSLDPLAPVTNARLGQFFYHDGQYTQAMEQLQNALEIEPNFWLTHLNLGNVYERKGMYAEALAEFQKARDLSMDNTETRSLTGYVLAISGNSAQAQVQLAELKSLSAQRYVPPYNIAMIHNGLGEKDEALEWLDRAYEELDVRLIFLKVDPKWNNLRADPNFKDLMGRVGFDQ